MQSAKEEFKQKYKLIDLAIFLYRLRRQINTLELVYRLNAKELKDELTRRKHPFLKSRNVFATVRPYSFFSLNSQNHRDELENSNIIHRRHSFRLIIKPNSKLKEQADIDAAQLAYTLLKQEVL